MKKRLLALTLAGALLLSGCSGLKTRQPDEDALPELEYTRPENEKIENRESQKTLKSQGTLSDGSDYILYANNELEISGDVLTSKLKSEKPLTEALKDVTVLTLNVKEIGEETCGDLSMIQSVNLGPDVTSIGDSAFSKCSALGTIQFPASVEAISMYENIRFPGWEVVRKIGEGSFGGVYEIHRTLPDGRVEKAALKKLTVPKDNSEIRELYSQSFSKENITAHYKDQMRELVNEYTLTQELNGCRNVVFCHDVQCVQHTDGIGWDIYIRMELLKPLKHVLSADYQEMAVLKLGLSLCNALLACQEHHIVHRDIKPENILVSDRGEFKLGDFGIAKVSEKTATGTMTGTMGYMAPEVANRWHYGAQADIYSLGMVLYWMMNRRTLPFLPFPPAIPTAAQRQEAANRRFAGESFPPPVNGSRELKAIVMKACAFSTEERYQTVRELQQDLYACYQQRRTGKTVDVSIPVNTDETVWTNEPTSGNTYSGNRSFRGSSQNEKTDTSKTNDPKTGRFAAQTTKQKPKKRKGALICVLAALCLCFAAFLGYLLAYGSHRERPAVSTPETVSMPETISASEAVPATGTINRMRSDPIDEDMASDDLRVFQSGILRKNVASITFLDTVTDAPEDAWDVSEEGNGRVLAWVTGQAPAYDLYIAGRGGVRAPENCFGLFAGYANATSITFGTAFDTSEVTDMGSMFTLCVKLTNLDVHNFDTSHVTDMHYMFSGCYSLTDLDLSSFDFSNVENYSGFMDNGRLYNGRPWEELFPNGSSDSSFRSQPTLAAGGYHTVGIRSDGTVIVSDLPSYDSNGQDDIDSWTDIVAVAAGGYHTVGLRDDGTVTAMGWNELGECDVDSWTGIVAVAAGRRHTVGLRSDGTVIATGWNDSSQCDVDSWSDIVAVAANGCTVGLRSDGTVVATGWNYYGQCDVDSWNNIVAVAAGEVHTVGLRSDGTVVVAGDNVWGECNVDGWTDIVAVAAGWGHTVGLRSDGTVVATGWNDAGQCDVSDWKNIRLPQK